MKIKITLPIREALLNKATHNIIKELFRKRKDKKIISIYLPLVTENVNNFFMQNNGVNHIPDSCFNQTDLLLVKNLEKIKAIKIKEISLGDNDRWFVTIKIKNIAIIEKINEWLSHIDNIINYGIFSLDTLTGEVYCRDNMARFHPSKGKFRVFREFINDENHRLSYKRIISKHEDKPEEKIEIDSSFVIETNQIIKDIKKSLKMKDKLSKLFIPAGNAYKLMPK